LFDIKFDQLELLEGFNLDNTKDRLIVNAIEMFAEHGYDKTSIRELANKADANIAAINYHFGGKKGLYHAVLEYTTDYMDLWAVPLTKEYESFLEKQDGNYDIVKVIAWLDQFLGSFISRAFESFESRMVLNKIIAREQLKPVYDVNNIYGVASIKLAEYIISDLLCKISNLDINDDKIKIYTLSIVGQIEAFTGTNATLKDKLNINEISENQIYFIKEVLSNQIKSVVRNLLKDVS
jgi:AcrR family transcriptional regulator